MAYWSYLWGDPFGIQKDGKVFRKSAMLAHPDMGNSIFGVHIVFSLARLAKFF